MSRLPIFTSMRIEYDAIPDLVPELLADLLRPQPQQENLRRNPLQVLDRQRPSSAAQRQQGQEQQGEQDQEQQSEQDDMPELDQPGAEHRLHERRQQQQHQQRNEIQQPYNHDRDSEAGCCLSESSARDLHSASLQRLILEFSAVMELKTALEEGYYEPSQGHCQVEHQWLHEREVVLNNVVRQIPKLANYLVHEADDKTLKKLLEELYKSLTSYPEQRKHRQYHQHHHQQQPQRPHNPYPRSATTSLSEEHQLYPNEQDARPIRARLLDPAEKSSGRKRSPSYIKRTAQWCLRSCFPCMRQKNLRYKIKNGFEDDDITC